MVSFEQITDLYESASFKFPKLQPPEKFEIGWIINGSIDVVDGDGKYWKTYSVRIIVPENYPYQLPMLFETGGEIPREADWHNSFTCCLSTTATMYSVLGDDLSLLNWLEKFAHPFLANHIVKKLTTEYAAGEFPHETEGIVKGYEKLFNVNGVKAVVEKLQTICKIPKMGRNEMCFCGSMEKFKYCYLEHPINHRYQGIPYYVLIKDLDEILRKKLMQ